MCTCIGDPALNSCFVQETNFSFNSASEACTGGVIHNIIEDSCIIFEKNVYIGFNQVTSGGAIYAVGSSINFGSSVHFHANVATENGGGISLVNSMFSSKNKAAHIKFESNRAMHDGGGMYVENKGENSACANDPALREFIISKKGIKNIC